MQPKTAPLWRQHLASIQDYQAVYSMHIRTMRASDLDFAAALTAAEGWRSETRAEFEAFFAYDPAGCFIAEVAGRRVAMCVATRYLGFGFVGELIVVEDMRGQGLGRRLLEDAISYLHAHSAGMVLLDGVPAALSLYERVGFRRICRSFRFIGPLRGQPHPGVRVMHASDMPAVAALDQAAFGADRRFFLERRLALYPELCWVLEEREEVVGFIMGRYGRGGISAGPWIVRPGLPQPERLLQSFALAAPGVDLVVGALDNNPPLCVLWAWRSTPARPGAWHLAPTCPLVPPTRSTPSVRPPKDSGSDKIASGFS
jgi:ribosomal protein S18 acetylase RimI-like enzyme